MRGVDGEPAHPRGVGIRFVERQVRGADNLTPGERECHPRGHPERMRPQRLRHLRSGRLMLVTELVTFPGPEKSSSGRHALVAAVRYPLDLDHCSAVSTTRPLMDLS